MKTQELKKCKYCKQLIMLTEKNKNHYNNQQYCSLEHYLKSDAAVLARKNAEKTNRLNKTSFFGISKEERVRNGRIGTIRYFKNNNNRQRQSEIMIFAMNKSDAKINCRLASFKRWKDPEYKKLTNLARQKALLKTHKNINNSEKKLLLIVRLLRLEFIYVGDYKLYVDSFNPDFVDYKNKIILEMFGDYWHRKDRESINRKLRRLCAYRKAGYKYIIIQEIELKNPNKVVDKIINKLEEFNVVKC